MHIDIYIEREVLGLLVALLPVSFCLCICRERERGREGERGSGGWYSFRGARERARGRDKKRERWVAGGVKMRETKAGGS